MTTHLVWLRNDLRINDNLALHAACRDSDGKMGQVVTFELEEDVVRFEKRFTP